MSNVFFSLYTRATTFDTRQIVERKIFEIVKKKIVSEIDQYRLLLHSEKESPRRLKKSSKQRNTVLGPPVLGAKIRAVLNKNEKRSETKVGTL